eukprot:358752-Chlamydomonas_euryale.AAC.3
MRWLSAGAPPVAPLAQRATREPTSRAGYTRRVARWAVPYTAGLTAGLHPTELANDILQKEASFAAARRCCACLYHENARAPMRSCTCTARENTSGAASIPGPPRRP